MGAWGVGLFSDDTACDVRDDYRQAITEGLSDELATEQVLTRQREALEDPDEGPVVWLALAATAWRLGRLDEATKDKALEIIAQRAGFERWDEQGLRRKREAVLDKLAETLRQPQKHRVVLKPKRKFVTDWKIGEVVAYRNPTGTMNLLHVVGLEESEIGLFPVVNVLRWQGSDVQPSKCDLDRADVVWFPNAFGKKKTWQKDLCLLLSERQLKGAEVVRWGASRRPNKSILQGILLRFCKDLNNRLSYVGLPFFDQDFGNIPRPHAAWFRVGRN